MKLQKYIGKKIKELRIKRGMNQEQLAALLDTTKQTVSRYEKGDRQANQDMLFSLSNIFNVSIDDFFPSNNEDNEMPKERYNYLPTAISAGLPINVDGITQSDKISIPDSMLGKWAGNKDIFITKICGDSMDKVMPDGSLIAVKPVTLDQLKNGDMVVFRNDYDYSVKYYYKIDDKLIFKPASYNTDHHEQHYTINDNIMIEGKVVMYNVKKD